MKGQPAARIELYKQVLTATIDGDEPPALKMSCKRLGRELAQDARVFDGGALDGPIKTVFLDHPLEVFDIWQLGHNDLPTVI